MRRPQDLKTCYSFGLWLQERREEAALSLRQLAREAGANYSYLARLEHGRHACPSQQMVLRLAQALGAGPSRALAAAGYLPDGCQSSGTEHDVKMRRQKRDQVGTEAHVSWQGVH